MQGKYMKRLVVLILVAMIAAVPALAEEATRSAKGTTRSIDTEDLYAPVGGQLLPFDLKEGDVVMAAVKVASLGRIKEKFGL